MSKTVMVFGTFDGLHEGHLDLFRQAKALGDRLVVIVARDDSASLIKGRAPERTQEERLALVQTSELVDEAVVGEKGNKHAVIVKYRPDIIALGYDQHSFEGGLEDTLMDNGLETTRIVRLKPFHPEKYKSSLLKKP